jgi:drug/metabolite transporter (DMT)-like permease
MTQKRLSLLLASLTILCWGSLATFANLLYHLPPFYILGVTFLIGSLPAFFRPKEMFPHWKILLVGVAGYFGYHFFLFYAFRFAPALEANLINYLWPVILVMMTPLFFREQKLKGYHFAGAFLSVIGCVFLVASKGAQLNPNNLTGYLLAFGAALSWPLYSIAKKKLPATPVWAIGSFCLVCGLLSLLTHAWLEPRVVLQPRDAILLFIMGIGPFGLAFYCWDAALRLGDSRDIGALAYLTPALSNLGLILFADQEIASTTLIAMVLIICGASSGLLDIFLLKR